MVDSINKFYPIQHPKWRSTPHSTDSMIDAIHKSSSIFDQGKIPGYLISQFKKNVSLEFVWSCVRIEGEGFDSLEEAEKALLLSDCFSPTIRNGCSLTNSVVSFPGLDFEDTEDACFSSNSTGYDPRKLQATLGFYRAMVALQAWQGNRSLEVLKVKELHSIMFMGVHDSGFVVGEYRAHTAFTLTTKRKKYVYVDPRQIPRAMENFTRMVNVELSRIEKMSGREKVERLLKLAGFTFTRFESIHPFQDGNGRIGRLLVAHVLYPIMPFFCPNNLYLYTGDEVCSFVDKTSYLECFESDETECKGMPTNVTALLIEGVYTTWKKLFGMVNRKTKRHVK